MRNFYFLCFAGLITNTLFGAATVPTSTQTDGWNTTPETTTPLIPTDATYNPTTPIILTTTPPVQIQPVETQPLEPITTPIYSSPLPTSSLPDPITTPIYSSPLPTSSFPDSLPISSIPDNTPISITPDNPPLITDSVPTGTQFCYPPIMLFDGYTQENLPSSMQVTQATEWGLVDQGSSYLVSYSYFPIDFCRYKQIKIAPPLISREGVYASSAPDYQIGVDIIPVYEGHPEDPMLPPVPSLTFYRGAVYVISAETQEGSWEHFEVSYGTSINEATCTNGTCGGGAQNAPHNPYAFIPGGPCGITHGVRRTEIAFNAQYYIGNQYPERADDAVIADRAYFEGKMASQNILTHAEYNPGSATSAALSILKVVNSAANPTFAFMSHGNNSIYKFRDFTQLDPEFYEKALNASLFVDNAKIYFTDFFPKNKIIPRMDFTSCCAANSTLDKNGKVAELLKKLTFPGSPIQMACGSTKQFMNHATGFSRSKTDNKYVKESLTPDRVTFSYEAYTWICHQPSDSCVDGWFKKESDPANPPDLQTYLNNSGSTPLDRQNCEESIKSRCLEMIRLANIPIPPIFQVEVIEGYKKAIPVYCKDFILSNKK